MYQAALSHGQQNRLNPYLVKEIMEASPQQLLIKIYDFAILNCQKHNLVKTNKAIQELINSLRFDEESSKEIALGLYRLYQFCQEEMRKQNYDIVHKILVELRESWRTAFNM
jgi:Flagellin-specific chaperone FliS